MRIHSNVLGPNDLRSALAESVPAASIDEDAFSVVGSRSHARAFEVRLNAPAGKDSRGRTRRPPMDGRPGMAATYSEWGDFCVALFARDPGARIGPYRDRDHFHRETRGEFMVGVDDFLGATS